MSLMYFSCNSKRIIQKEDGEKMTRETLSQVDFSETLGALDIRLGRVVEVELELRTHKPTYKMVVDYGKFGRRTSYGRFTTHPIEEVRGRLVLGVLNLGERQMGPVVSEALILGVQYPKAESGEATFISPAVDAKIGSKMF
jgi:tRNA-binding protein